MGFAMGSSHPLHSSSYHSLFPSISSSSNPLFFHSFQRKTHDFSKRRRRRINACVQHHDPNDDVFCHRRAILFMGISVLPFLNLKARAVENHDPDEFENSTRAQELNQISEVPNASSNPFLTLSNGLGIIASGVLGAFYALAQKEKTVNIATIESIKTKLVEKETAIVSIQKSFESKLQNEKEERNEQIKKINQEKQSLTTQLRSANNTVNGLEIELQNEKKIIQDLENQIDRLTVDLKKTSDDKQNVKTQLKDKLFAIDVLQERINVLNTEIKDKEDNIGNVGSALAAKKSDFEKLNSIYEETRDELTGSKSKIEGLKQNVFKLEKELGSKSSRIDDLNAEIRSLCESKTVIRAQLESVRKDYDELKVVFEKKSDSDAKILEENGKKIEELKERLESTLTKLVKHEELVNELTNERDNLKKNLDVEVEKSEGLQKEIRFVQKTLEETRNEAAELAGLLEHSENTRKNLEEEASRIQSEYSESKSALQKRMDFLKQTAEMLTNEIRSTKDVFVKNKEELNRVSVELLEVSGIRDNLSKELVDTYNKLENANHELKEEKKNVVSLTIKVNDLESEIVKVKESRKSTESELEETTKALDETNKNTMILSQELEISKSKIYGIEVENEVLYKSLDEQKRIIQEARENMEDAHNVVLKLGKEREILEKKGSKFEKELAAAKGEILRLKNEIEENAEKVNRNGIEEKVNRNGIEENAEAVAVKKGGRRKKVVSQQKES